MTACPDRAFTSDESWRAGRRVSAFSIKSDLRWPAGRVRLLAALAQGWRQIIPTYTLPQHSHMTTCRYRYGAGELVCVCACACSLVAAVPGESCATGFADNGSNCARVARGEERDRRQAS